MKIGLDIHGVLSDWETMTPIVHELIAEGHELYVVSGAPKRELEKEIVELGYQVEWFKDVYSIIDWLLDNNVPGKIWHNEKGWWYDDDVRWWKTKAEIAEFYEIDILLDDQKKYKQGYLKPGTFTLYSTFKSFKGWKDPSSFLLKIASYYRPAPPWKLVAKEDIPVQKLEPPTGMIFYMDVTCNPNKEPVSEERQKELSLISALHKLYPHIGLAQARRFLIDSNWDWCKAVKLAKNYKKVILYKEQKDPAESSVVQMRLTINKNRGNKMAKILYLAVDMQKDFMDQDGALYVTGSEEIKSNIKKLATKMDKIATHKFYTMDWHEEDDSELSDNPDFKTTFPPHCIAGTKGAWLIPQAIGEDMYSDEDDFMDDRTLVFYKNEFSVFKGNPDFLDSMNAYAYFDKIYIAGVSGCTCVKYVLEGLLEHKGKELEFETLYIVEDCIASLNKEAFDLYLTELILQYDFIKVINHNTI
jgi:nicotinamidase/pyrazinamidase